MSTSVTVSILPLHWGFVVNLLALHRNNEYDRCGKHVSPRLGFVMDLFALLEI